MAVLGRVLVSSAERLDLPDLLSIDSYAAGDWKFFLKGLVGDSKPYILKGFDVIDPQNAIGTQSCSIRVADSVVFYPGSSSGSFFHGLQEGHAQATPLVPELRKNTVNYVYLTFSTFNTSVDTRAFWDPDKDGGAGGEFTQDINTQSVLKVEINVSTGSFPANTIPIAKITVGPVVITAIEDTRDLLYRLGSGGINPNPFNTYQWKSFPSSSYQRSEPPTKMLAGGVNPYQGADKNITSMKEWMDAIMSKLRELGGTTYWYDDTSTFGIVNNFFDAVGITFKSKGQWIHSQTVAGLITWTEDFQIKMTGDPRTYIVRQGSKTLQDEQVMYLPLQRNKLVNSTDEEVSWINGQPYVNTVGGAVGIFANLAKGDWIKKTNDTFDKWLRVEEFYDAVNLGGSTTTASNAKSVRLSSTYLGTTGQQKARYDRGVYDVSDVVVSDRDSAAINNIGGNFHWLSLRSDIIQKIGNITTTQLNITISEHDGYTAKCTSASAHGLSDGERVTITSTTNFNGTYVVEVESNTIFYITKSGPLLPDDSGNAFYAVITTVARSTAYGLQEESANHGFKTNDTIDISGTSNYNNKYTIKVRTATEFSIPVPSAIASESTGLATLAKVMVRTEGSSAQIIQGESADVGSGTADNIRQYVGMASLSEISPTYSVPSGYNTINGMQNYNSGVSDNLTARVSKLTAMMANKAQDKTVKYIPNNITTISNTTNGISQEVTFNPSGSWLSLVTPGSIGTATVMLPSTSPGISLLVNQVAYVSIDRNNLTTPSIQVSNITSLPVDENIFVIAMRMSATDVYLWDSSIVTVGSIPGPGNIYNVMRQNQALKLVDGGTWSWNLGTETLTWSSAAYVQIPGLNNSANTILAGSIVLASGEVAYVDINRQSPGGNLTVQVATNSSLSMTTDRFIIARRENNDVVVGLHSMRLIDQESKKLYAGISDQSLTYIGQPNSADSTPTYSNIPNGLATYTFNQGDNLTLAIGQTAGNVNSILLALDNPSFDEFIEVVAASPTGNQLLAPVTNGTIITLPNNSRLTGSPPQYYTVGKGTLEIYLNGQMLQLGEAGGWSEVGISGNPSNQIQIGQQLETGDFLTFRIDATGGPGSGGAGAVDDNFYTLPTKNTASNLDYIPVYDVADNAYKKQTRAVFLAGLNNLVNVRTVTANWSIITSDDLIIADTTTSLITLTLPTSSGNTGKKFLIKKANNAPNDLILNTTGGDLIDGSASFSFNANGLTNYGSLTIITDGLGNWWLF